MAMSVSRVVVTKALTCFVEFEWIRLGFKLISYHEVALL